MPEGLLLVLTNRARTNGTLPRDSGDLHQVTAAHRNPSRRLAAAPRPGRPIGLSLRISISEALLRFYEWHTYSVSRPAIDARH